MVLLIIALAGAAVYGIGKVIWAILYLSTHKPYNTEAIYISENDGDLEMSLEQEIYKERSGMTEEQVIREYGSESKYLSRIRPKVAQHMVYAYHKKPKDVGTCTLGIYNAFVSYWN